MRAVVQRVSSAHVYAEAGVQGEIARGIILYLGVEASDTCKDADYIINKVLNLRIFDDDLGRMNLSLADIRGELLVVSQFTLLGDARKGRRPSYNSAADGASARTLYTYAIEQFRAAGRHTATGAFQTHMAVHSVVDGPVTILLDSKKTF